MIPKFSSGDAMKRRRRRVASLAPGEAEDPNGVFAQYNPKVSCAAHRPAMAGGMSHHSGNR